MTNNVSIARLAWSLAEISKQTGLSVGYLRNEVRAKRLPVKNFGRRVLVLEPDLQAYLAQGSSCERGAREAVR